MILQQIIALARLTIDCYLNIIISLRNIGIAALFLANTPSAVASAVVTAQILLIKNEIFKVAYSHGIRECVMVISIVVVKEAVLTIRRCLHIFIKSFGCAKRPALAEHSAHFALQRRSRRKLLLLHFNRIKIAMAIIKAIAILQARSIGHEESSRQAAISVLLHLKLASGIQLPTFAWTCSFTIAAHKIHKASARRPIDIRRSLYTLTVARHNINICRLHRRCQFEQQQCTH